MKASLSSHTKFELTESIHHSYLLKRKRHRHLSIQEKEYIASIAKRSLEDVQFAWRWYGISALTMRRIVSCRSLWEDKKMANSNKFEVLDQSNAILFEAIEKVIKPP